MTEPHKYHHGDLRAALLDAAKLQLQQGIDQLSLRKLAEQVGVSRTAPYHHFKDKHELLCALASDGFQQLEHILANFQDDQGDLEMSLRRFVKGYLNFALDNPETYELMFGRTIWKSKKPTPELKAVAFNTFRHYSQLLSKVIVHLPEAADKNPLRLAQASWATVHGLCRLFIDGIYVNRPDLEEVLDASVQLILNTMSS